ncbi:MAG: hypothetical protein ACR2JP_11140 [Acidimicrobiia bacterium]
MTGDDDAFIEALRSSGPDPELADRLGLFGQFVGSWVLEVTNYDADGGGVTLSGEWHFGWVLGGRAVADIWICPSRSATDQTPYEHGMSVRFYDESIEAWRSTWIGPVRRIVRPFTARPIGAEIVLEGRIEGGLETRWVFSDITPTSFLWRNEESIDGPSWRLNQTFVARRAG